MKKLCRFRIISVLLTLVFSSIGFGALLAYEGFDYGSSNGVMTGLNGGYGFDGGWVSDANYVPASLPIVSGYGYNPVGGAMLWDNNSGASRVMSRNLALPIDLDPATEQVYYISAFVKYIDAIRTASSEYTQVLLMENTIAKCVVGISSGESFYVEIPSVQSVNTPTKTLLQNNTLLMILKLVVKNDGTDTLYGLYYGAGEDTILSEPSLDMYDVILTGNLTGLINGIAFSVGANNEQALIDEIRIGENWEDVVNPTPTDARIPPIPFDRGLVFQIDADHVWEAYEDDGTARAFSLINVAQNNNITFNGKTPDQMPVVIPDVLNGHAVLDFDGNDYMQCAARSYFDCNKVTTFAVFKASNDITTTQIVFRNGYANYDGNGTTKTDLWGILIEGGYIKSHWRSNTGSFKGVQESAVPFQNQFGVVCCSWDGDRVRQQLNNGTAIVSATGANCLLSQHSISKIGCNNLNMYFTGQVAEILVYNRLLTDDQKVIVGAYLADKYGLTTAYPAVTLDDCEDIWRHQKGMPIDLSQDCIVGITDITNLAANWLNDVLTE